MATGTFAWYGRAFKSAFNKLINWETDEIYIALAGTGYAPDPDNHSTWADVVSNEVTGGTAWPAGGWPLDLRSIAYVPASNYIVFKAQDINKPDVTLTGAKYAIIYNRVSSSTVNTSKPLIGYITFSETLNPSAGALNIDFDDVNGVARIVY